MGTPLSSDLGRALDQISEIHGHLTRAEVYRGLGARPVALSATVALAAALLQGRLGAGGARDFALYWTLVAAVAALPGAAVILFRYLRREDVEARRRTRRVVGQFLPCLAAGLGVTLAFTRIDPSHIALLPGIWAAVFGLGLFSVRPHLPHAIGWVALFYLLAGMGMLWLPGERLTSAMGAVFSIGQLGAALVLHRNHPRGDHVE